MILGAWYHSILATVFAMFCLILMGVILLQRGRGVGLAGAFGGAGGHTTFGSKTGDVLTWATVVFAGGVLLFAVLLNYVFVPVAVKAPTPAAPPPPPATSAPAEQTRAPLVEPGIFGQARDALS